MSRVQNSTVEVSGLQCIYSGKVRDLYQLDPDHLLIVASDRLSAFDVILPTPIPGKGELLTEMSNYWFARLQPVIRNHLQLARIELEQALPDPVERDRLRRRAVVARKLRALPLEAIVRGYLAGSGWQDYQASGRICGIKLPPGLRLGDRLPEPLFTPSTKAAAGQHDSNISQQRAAELIGTELIAQVQEVGLRLYRSAAEHALLNGIIIADTKFEFGLSDTGELVLIDELLTPDSSRFWPAEHYRPGRSQPSLDKQYVRDYLQTLDWDRTAPGPTLPATVIEQTRARYELAVSQICRDSKRQPE